MKGTNTLTLNEATMIEIIQYWLTNKALNPNEPSPKVSGVKGNSSYEGGFTVTLMTEDDQ